MHSSKGHKLVREAKRVHERKITHSLEEGKLFEREVRSYMHTVRPIVRSECQRQDITTQKNTARHIRKLRNLLGFGISDGPYRSNHLERR